MLPAWAAPPCPRAAVPPGESEQLGQWVRTRRPQLPPRHACSSPPLSSFSSASSSPESPPLPPPPQPHAAERSGAAVGLPDRLRLQGPLLLPKSSPWGFGEGVGGSLRLCPLRWAALQSSSMAGGSRSPVHCRVPRWPQGLTAAAACWGQVPRLWCCLAELLWMCCSPDRSGSSR